MAWQIILTDRSHIAIGEVLNASNRRVDIGLNKLDTASFSVRIDNPLAPQLASAAGFIKIYKDGVLRFRGPIMSAEETGDDKGATIAINAISAGWIFTRRLVRKTTVAGTNPFATGTAKYAAIKTLIDEANAEFETGIDVDITKLTSGSTFTAPYDPPRFHTLLDVITELSQGFGGFDWRVYPVDSVSGPKIGEFICQTVMGTTKNSAVFEWGNDGRYNIASYKRAVTRDTQVTGAWATPIPTGTTPVSNINFSARSDWGLLEELVSTDLNSTFSTELVAEHIAVRSFPRTVIEFTPHIDPTASGRLPQYGVDYGIGDTVRARAVYGGSVRFDAMVRVWGVSFDINESGLERATITLADS